MLSSLLCRAYARAALSQHMQARCFSMIASHQSAPVIHQISALPVHRACSSSADQGTLHDTEDQNEQLINQNSSVIVKAKQVRHSPKKLMLLCRQLAGLNLTEAYAQMSFSEKRIAKTRLKQLVSSAWYVAQEHHGLDPRELVIKEAWVGKQEFLKRRRYHSKGRAGMSHKPICMVTLRLEPQAPHYVGTRKDIEKHGKFEGLIRTHWKRWKKLKKKVPLTESASSD